jgi:hypothetical protein
MPRWWPLAFVVVVMLAALLYVALVFPDFP